MFSHIMLGANDIEKSKLFYDKVLGVLGCEPGILSVLPSGHKRYLYMLDGNMFLISEPIDDNEATHGNGSTTAFRAKDPEMADKWHEAGISHGGKKRQIHGVSGTVVHTEDFDPPFNG